MFELIDLAKKLIADIANQDVSGGLRDTSSILNKLADLYDAIKGGLAFATPEQEAELLAVTADLQKAVAEHKPVQGGLLDKISFDNLIELMAKIAALLKLLKGA